MVELAAVVFAVYLWCQLLAQAKIDDSVRAVIHWIVLAALSCWLAVKLIAAWAS